MLAGYGAALASLGFMGHEGHLAVLIGTALKGAGTATKAASQLQQRTLQQRRDQIEAAMEGSGRRLIVVVDDIDRLDQREIQDIMRLVKLTGNFPNIVYVLAFDRDRVERALSEVYGGTRADGRAYLEKILQLMLNMPEISEHALTSILATRVNQLLAGKPHATARDIDFTNIFMLAIRPLFRTIRDVHRYVNTLATALDVIGDEVNAADVAALEAVRLLVPDAFVLLPAAVELVSKFFTSSVGMGMPNAEQGISEAFEEILKAGGAQRETIRVFLGRTFPSSERFVGGSNVSYTPDSFRSWRIQRRVAHPEVFRFYLEKSLPTNDIPAAELDEVAHHLADAARLEKLLSQFTGPQLVRVLDRLEYYEDEFPTSDTGDGVAMLINIAPKLPRTAPTGWNLTPDDQLRRVVLRIIRRVETEKNRIRTIERAVNGTNNLSGRVLLVKLVGHREHVGHKLVPSAVPARLEAETTQAILAARSFSAGAGNIALRAPRLARRRCWRA